jgi:flagellin-like hook-associated protein FlgL
MIINFNAKKIFSVPLNPKLNEQQFLEFYQFLERHKDWISDVYFTSRIAPFKQDAMGDVFVIEEEQLGIETALNIQKHLGIPVSATFNNIQTEAKTYITALATQRSTLGAYQNRLEYTVSNVTDLSGNLSAARSRVQDTDYAAETASLTKGQILQQAATAMLAQANQMPNVILTLLK